MTATMKAVRIHAYGGPEEIVYEDAPRPEPGSGEVLVRVRAAGVNPVDWKTRSGSGMAKKFGERFPLVLGWDASGVVEEVGTGVDAFRAGDEVYGLPRFPEPGEAYAEYMAAPAGDLATKPANLGHLEAAALPLVTLTAWQALFDVAGLEQGQSVLVHAAAGGVGHVAVQLARWKGARVVGTSSARNADFVRSLGADEVVAYDEADLEEVVSEVDVVLDPVGGEALERSFGVLRQGGALVSLVAEPSEEQAEQHQVRAQRMLVHPDGAQLAEVSSLVEAGHLRPAIDAELPLADARKAHEMSEAGHTRGKIVLRVD